MYNTLNLRDFLILLLMFYFYHIPVKLGHTSNKYIRILLTRPYKKYKSEATKLGCTRNMNQEQLS